MITIPEAITQLRQMQGQIVHGTKVFGEIADLIKFLNECKEERDQLEAALAAAMLNEGSEELVNALAWFKAHGFTFDDKITVKDVIDLQKNALACRKIKELSASEPVFPPNQTLWEAARQEGKQT